jgi:hypothetical protein
MTDRHLDKPGQEAHISHLRCIDALEAPLTEGAIYETYDDTTRKFVRVTNDKGDNAYFKSTRFTRADPACST